jgi:enoyl-CoA hydratase/carnithine racemase
MSSFQNIIYEKERGRARIVLNRPERLNALSLSLLTELHDAVWEADNDRDVHCLIVKGAGRAFSAGYDLAGGGNQPPASSIEDRESNRYRGGGSQDDDIWQMERSQRLRMALFDAHKPSIAQVHGYCLAGGTDVALLCDMVVAAESAVIGFPAGRSMGALPNNMWLYNVGPQWAKRLQLTGDSVTGAEAQQLGLVMKAVPDGDLEAEVEQLADRLALIDPEVLTVNKRIINLGLELMGARTLQRLAVENDARGHTAAAARSFFRQAREDGLRKALADRDGPFGDGRARVNGPEKRDAEGRLLP